MAVHTAHVALLDLSDDDYPWRAVRKETHLTLLRPGVPMIEFEDDHVRFATVDARMVCEVIPNALAVLRLVADASAR